MMFFLQLPFCHWLQSVFFMLPWAVTCFIMACVVFRANLVMHYSILPDLYLQGLIQC